MVFKEIVNCGSNKILREPGDFLRKIGVGRGGMAKILYLGLISTIWPVIYIHVNC